MKKLQRREIVGVDISRDGDRATACVVTVNEFGDFTIQEFITAKKAEVAAYLERQRAD